MKRIGMLTSGGDCQALNAAMRGAGEAVFPMANTVLSMLLIRVPACYLLANLVGRDSMFLGIGIGWAIGFLSSALYYLGGRWKQHKSLVEAEKSSA